jgi:heavy metal sensor kinase
MPPILQLGKQSFQTITATGVVLRTLSSTVRIDGRIYTVQLADSVSQYYEMLNRLAWLAVWFLPAVLLLSSVGGYWLCRRALAPVDEIAASARSISAQNLNLRLTVPRTGDELQRLSETLNDMIARLDASFKRITQFTADASHELRTPIALIRTTSELSTRKPKSLEDCLKALERIHLHAERMTRLIDTLMELARADSGAEELNISAMNLSVAMSDACDQGEPSARAKQITLTRTISSGVFVYGDAEALRRLFLILIDNAVKYTPSNGSISVSLSRARDHAMCEVRDCGIGIPNEELPKIFGRFYRVDKTRSRESGGAGLGLAIAQWIAEAHRIVIEVESILGHGSVFRVRMPIKETMALGERTRGVPACSSSRT